MKDLTSGNIYKTFLLFTIPLVLAALLSQTYNLLDTVIAGKFLGDSGIAAIGSTSSFMDFLSSAFWGYSTGFSILVARLFGAKDFVRMKHTVRSNLFVMVAAMILCCALCLIFADPILGFLKVDPDIYAQSKIYYLLYVSGLPLIVLSTSGVHICNSLGMSGYPLKMSILSAALNLSGNLLSVAVFKAGVAGIALSSVFAALVADVFYVFKIQSCYKELSLSKDRFSLDLSLVKTSLSYAVPTMAQQFTMYCSSFLVSPLVNGISGGATAAYAVAMKLYSLSASVYQNANKTLSTYTAQSVGAQKFGQLKRGVRVGWLQANLFLLPPLVLCVFFAEPVCRAFFPAGFVGKGLDYAVLFARWYLPWIVFNLINNLFHSFYRGVAAMRLLLTMTLLGAAARVVLSFLLQPLQGIRGIYLALVLSWVIEAAVTTALYLSGRWKLRLMKEYSLDPAQKDVIFQ